MRRWTAAGLLIGLPIVALLIVLVGGGRVRRCLGGTACTALPPLEGPPIIGTTAGLVAVILVIGLVWLAIAALAMRRVWRRDRPRVRRWAPLVLFIPIATGTLATAIELLQDQGKRIALETGIGSSLLVASVLAPIVLARLALLAED